MRAIPLLVLLALSFQEVPEPAGSLAWKLGKNDFARFNAYKVTLAGGEETARVNPERLAGIFGYEIQDKTQYRPSELSKAELPLLLGFSLPPRQLKVGQSHVWTVEIDEGFDYGPVTATCSATRVAAVEVNLVPCAKINLNAKLSRSARASAAARPPKFVHNGNLNATLYFDPAKGVARRLDFHFLLTLAQVDAKGALESIDQREQLDLSEVLTARHRTFEAEVNAAIEKGIAYVWRSFNAKDGRWGAHHQHTTGQTALALLTILKGSMDRKDPRIANALNWLISQPLQHTYDVALSLMALEAFYSPGDAAARSASAADKDIASRIDPGHARWGGSAAKWLEINLAKGMWSYPSTDANARDFSNTQYGVLGLYSGARCGFAPDLAIVRQLMESYLRVQQKDGPRTDLALHEGEVSGKTTARFAARARGWPYYDHPDDPVYGSMTAGGVSSLVILDALRRRGSDAKYGTKEQGLARTAIRDGWAWMFNRWTVKGNPARGREWIYYYLYGLERSAMLDGVGRVGDHDWYWEGATFLVSNQASDGAWFTGNGVAFYDVCFAILFLKRATVRVATGK
jgi:hypothetical protein